MQHEFIKSLPDEVAVTLLGIRPLTLSIEGGRGDHADPYASSTGASR